jgi:diguanylate cyclase (GGDEF)-like protein
LLYEQLQHAQITCLRSKSHIALLVIDLDHFKTLNDTLGHDYGDKLLEQVAQRIQSSVRGDDTVARLGGDEFVVLLENLSEQSFDAALDVEDVSKKIMSSIELPFIFGEHEYISTMSIGISLQNMEHPQSADDLMKQADIAMYQAKKAGRNTFRFFDLSMQEVINNRAQIERELCKAIELQQLRLYFQVQMDESNKPIGAEALLRWQHPKKGLLLPAHFISVAEETGMICTIGLWVLNTACAQLKSWESDPVKSRLVISVNVSAHQFRQKNFVNKVFDLLMQHSINPSRLNLELTESSLLHNVDEIVSSMNALSKIGVTFSLDDFGTGYSSLQYLKRLPINQIKIDQSFVKDLVTDSNDQAIVRTIISIAKALGIEVIAEGVETVEQRQHLLTEGCKQFQGFLFGKPVPINQIFTAFNTENITDEIFASQVTPNCGDSPEKNYTRAM